MFTEGDLRGYFNQIQEIEKKMLNIYQRLQDQLTHTEYKRIFAQMAREETAHENLIESLKDLLTR